MDTLKTQIIEHGPKEIKDPSLHFRDECGEYTCGAHKSWDEGFQAAVELLWPVVEAAKTVKVENVCHCDLYRPFSSTKKCVPRLEFSKVQAAISDLQSKLGSEK